MVERRMARPLDNFACGDIVLPGPSQHVLGPRSNLLVPEDTIRAMAGSTILSPKVRWASRPSLTIANQQTTEYRSSCRMAEWTMSCA